MIKWILHKLKGDKIIWLVIFLISLISLLAVYSSTSTLAFKYQEGNTEYYLLKHFLLLAIGMGAMYVVHLFDYRLFAKLSTLMLYLTIPLLAYTLFFGSNINQASRWITILGQSFQPSDLGKLTLMVYLAKILTEKQETLKDFKTGFVPVIAVIALICGLIAPADFSTAAVLFATCFMLIFIAGVDLKHLGALVVVGSFAIVLLFSFSPRKATYVARLTDYVERWTNPDYEPNYQTVQANIAIATGGVVGKGVGKSSQKNFLPHPYSDFVYAIILEEYGLFGGLLVMGLYLLLLFRCIAIVTVSKTFGALLATGLAFLIVIQALINMGVTVGILPVTGLPLPMLSMGGTSLIFTGGSLGIILSVSRSALEGKAEVNHG